MMTQKLEKGNWERFRIGDCFDVSRPKARNKDDYELGDIPFVASGSVNNGVMKCCKPIEGEPVDEGRCITVSPVDGSAFYQPLNFLGRGGAGSSILILRGEKLNLPAGLFFSRMIEQTCSKYTYGHMGNKDSIRREFIQLPVTIAGEPDYAFAEQYAAEVLDAKLDQYRRYAEKRVSALDYKSIPPLNEKEWRPFVLEDVFSIYSGTRLETRNKIPGMRPFIGAADNNNGVTGFVANDNASKDGNVLGVNYNGNGMCIGFYHPYECVFSDDVKRFHLKNYQDNAFVLLFLKVIILQQKNKFGYLYKFNASRMAKQRLLLPVNEADEPDYGYMEQYAKNMMLKKYEQYFQYVRE